MAKAVFVKAHDDNGSIQYYPLPNQEITTGGGTRVKYDPKLPAILRDPAMRLPFGVIFATESLTLKSGKTHYVCGSKVVQLTDANGNMLPIPDGTPRNADLVVYQQQYDEYLNGANANNSFKGTGGRITLLQNFMDSKEFAPPTLESDGFIVDKDLWYYLLRGAYRKEPLLMIGETGVGKTALVQFLCKKLNIPLNIFDMAISNPVPALCGSHRINSAGVSEFQEARFARKMREKGMNLLDELTRAAPSANNVLLPVTDDRRTLYIESSMHDPEIKLHDEAVIWATANIGMQYVGTSTLDSALMNRFEMVEIKQPEAHLRTKLMHVRTKVDKASAKQIIDFSEKVNADKSFSKKISTRQELKVSGLVYDGFSIPKALEYTVLNQFEYDEVDGGERGRILTLIQSL